MWKVQLFKLNYDDREVEAVANTVRSGWLTMGEKIQEFEGAFGKFLGEGVYCTATANCTAALHMALMALGVGHHDEVLVPALTFVADINVVKVCGASPILVDCTSQQDWNIDPQDLQRKITEKTKAVIIVHYAGYPCNMDAICSVLDQANTARKKRGRTPIGLIEDAAHTPGATFKGRQCGTFGDVGCFSFFSNKNLSIGEGGMFVTRDKELDRNGKLLRSHGMTALTLDRHKGRAISYDVLQPGLNYRMDEMRAALGLVQLAKLADGNSARKRLVELYLEELKTLKGITIPFQGRSEESSAYHIFPLLLDPGYDRTAVIEALKTEGIQASIHYPDFRSFSAYKNELPHATPIASDISSRGLTLPLYPTMQPSEVRLVCEALGRAMALGCDG
jgi:dTDP-4-amino-4,6-dideoxygalactose transaminase